MTINERLEKDPLFWQRGWTKFNNEKLTAQFSLTSFMDKNEIEYESWRYSDLKADKERYELVEKCLKKAQAKGIELKGKGLYKILEELLDVTEPTKHS